MQFQDKLFPDGTNAKTLKERCKIDWQPCRMVFDTCTRAHPHSHHPLKRHNMLPCRIMPRMKRQHNISQWPDFDSLTHLTHLDHWQYSWQIPCFKLHNTLHVHFTPNAYWTKLCVVFDDSIQERLNTNVGFCMPCIPGNCLV